MRLLSKTFRSLKIPNGNLKFSKPSLSSSTISCEVSNSSPTPKPRPWFVYLILSTNSPIKTYVGVTTNFSRRLKQHNGEIKGGAKASRAGQPWICACIIRGFRDQSQACEFESKWKSISRKSSYKRKNVTMPTEEDDTSLRLLQHRQAALSKVQGLLDCSHLEFDWKLNPF